MATESTKIKDRDKVIYLVSFAAIVVAIYFLLRKHGAGTAAAATPVAATAVPQQQPAMFYPLTALGTFPAIPPASINVSFTPAVNTNQPTGYVPLYGFIGYGGQWF